MAKKARILIVEDEAIVAEDLEMAVTNIGYEVVGRAASAKDAVKKALEAKPDLVLMDIVLRGVGNGIDASHEIKKEMGIPIIFLTAYSDVDLIDRAKSTEPYAYLVKPFQERQLLASIEMALYKSRTEAALRESEERFRTIVETAPSLLMISDAEGNNIYVSPNCEDFTGYTQEELQGRVIWWVHEDDMPKTEELFERTFREGVGNKDLEYKAVKKNGDLWYASSSWEPLRDEEGNFKGIVFQTVDITKRKRAEVALRESEEKYHLLADNTVDGVWQMNLDFEFTYVNPSVLQMLGFTQEEWIGSSLFDHCSSEDREFILNLVKDTLKKDPESSGETFEMQMLHKNGERIDVEITTKILFDDEGNPVGSQGATRDITERKRAEEKLKRLTLSLQEHVKELEESKKKIAEAYSLREYFLKETSHRIITPVAIIGGYTDLLLESTNLDDNQKQKLRIVREKDAEIQQLVNDSLAGKYLEEEE